GRARPAVEQAHLAEVLAGVQPRPLARGDLHAGGAIEDEEEFLAGFTAPGQHGAFRHLDDLADARDRPQLAARAAGQHRHVLQPVDLVVLAHPPAEEAPAERFAAWAIGDRAVEDPADEFHESALRLLPQPSRVGRLPYVARTSVLMPPRTLKSPVTSAQRG